MTDAEIWCALNKHEWPEALGPKPDDWLSQLWPRMQEIMGRIGYKECLREWNKDELQGEAFEDFWSSRSRRV